MLYFFFFFSSRRRHTRCSRDWSSDVCSSDLYKRTIFAAEFVLDGQVRIGKGVVRVKSCVFKQFRPGEGTENAEALAKAVLHFCERSEEHTSELQSRLHLVCRLLLEKKKKTIHSRSLLRYRSSLLAHHRLHDRLT